MKKNITTIIFWGSLWGLVEATVGHVLHIIPFKIGWMMWFPIAFYFMNKVHTITNMKGSVMYAALLAALIKLIDLFAPIRIDYVINPAISIIFEGLAIFITLGLFEKYNIFNNKVYAIVINSSWRLMYIIYVLFLPSFLRDISPISGLQPFIKFFFIENLVTSLIVFAYIQLSKQYKEKIDSQNYNYYFAPSLSMILLSLSIYIQYII